MAIIKTSALIGAVSGALGTVTFSRQRAGNVIAPRGRRVLHAGTQVSTAGLPAYNSIAHAQRSLSICAQGWRAMSEAQRQAWRVRAAKETRTNRLSESRPYTAYALFVEFAMPFVMRNEVLPTTPPPGGRLPAPPIISAAWTDATTYQITLAAKPHPTSAAVILASQPNPLGAHRTPSRRPPIVSAGFGNTTTFTVIAARHFDYWGIPAVGSIIDLRFYFIRLSNLQSMPVRLQVPYSPP